MKKERLTAFTDAVLAIIMTILVLELKKPDEISWIGLWNLRTNFLAYFISFFWLGTMWVNLHRSWDKIEKINNKMVWISLILLFFSSLFPYVTNLVSMEFNNPVAQTFYGIVVLLVSFANVWLYEELAHISNGQVTIKVAKEHNRYMVWDITIKLIGLILTLTIFPSAMMWAVVITAVILILPRSIE